MQYGRKCLVCKNTRHRERGLRLFRFPPRDSPLWPRWLQACGLTEADIDPKSREPPRLCHRHFQQKDFLTRQLTGMAVPSLFPVQVFTEAAPAEVEAGEEPSEGNQQEQQQVIEEVVYQADVQPDQLIEFNRSIEDFLGDVDDSVDVTPAEEVEDSVQSSKKTNGDTVEQLTTSEKVCNDENHKSLLEELLAERAKIENLRQEILEKDKVINDQQELLTQLGVQFVTYSD
uniref:THAP-type domain-containing protein n=1 Tax=Culex tarsalis TaxID=7177 RepID=A0A1Q3F3H7_CULTA